MEKLLFFINEYNYKWAERYAFFLKQIIFRGYEIGLHSHVESIISNYESLIKRIKIEKKS